MSEKTQYHVTSTGDGWQIKRTDASRASAKTATKAEAIKRAAEIATKNGNATVKIHKMDGRIQEERTYTRDKDPRGTKG